MSHLFTPSEKVRLNLSQREHTDAGALLRQMYYNKTALLDSLSRNECSGFPNNGGEHTLSLNMTPPDLVAFRALVEHDFRGHRGLEHFLKDFDAQFTDKTGYSPTH